jgi:RND superfamily putative drug exporter
MPTPRSFVRRAAGLSARRPRTTLTLWLLFVAVLAFAGSVAGTRSLTDAEGEVGEAARADAIVAKAGLDRPAVERVVVGGRDAEAAVADLQRRLDGAEHVARVAAPRRADGRCCSR